MSLYAKASGDTLLFFTLTVIADHTKLEERSVAERGGFEPPRLIT
jgi:hypothetical protein